MKTVVTVGGTLALSARLFAVASMCLGVTSAMAANYWIGADDADIADAANWAEGGSSTGAHVLPTTSMGYFSNKSGIGTEYRLSLGSDISLFQLYWYAVNLRTVLDLGGHTLTLTASSVAPIRIDTDFSGIESVITNGTLTFQASSRAAWVLGNNQCLTFGAGLVFNGNAALHSGTSHSGSSIIVRDGAKVNGRLYVGDKQKNCEILVLGDGTKVDFSGGAFLLSSSAAFGDNIFRVADGAIVTNAAVTLGRDNCTNLTLSVDGGIFGATSLTVGGNGISNTLHVANGGTFSSASDTHLGDDASTARAGRIVVDSGALFYNEGWNGVGTTRHTYMGKSGVAGCNEIHVGDGANYKTRICNVYGTGNAISISNGTFHAVAFNMAGGNVLRFAGRSPCLHQTGQNVFSLGAGCALSFDIPVGGYTTTPLDLDPSTAFTMPEDTVLEVDALDYAEASGGKVTLAQFSHGQVITFSDTLLSRWNSELAPKRCSIAYDSATRKLILTVKRNTGFVISFR